MSKKHQPGINFREEGKFKNKPRHKKETLCFLPRTDPENIFAKKKRSTVIADGSKVKTNFLRKSFASQKSLRRSSISIVNDNSFKWERFPENNRTMNTPYTERKGFTTLGRYTDYEDDLEQDIRNLKEDKEDLKQEIRSLKRKIRSLKGEKDDLKQENRSLKRENRSLKGEKDDLKQENRSLKRENRSFKEENDNLKAIIQRMEKEKKNQNMEYEYANQSSIIQRVTKLEKEVKKGKIIENVRKRYSKMYSSTRSWKNYKPVSSRKIISETESSQEGDN